MASQNDEVQQHQQQWQTQLQHQQQNGGNGNTNDSNSSNNSNIKEGSDDNCNNASGDSAVITEPSIAVDAQLTEENSGSGDDALGASGPTCVRGKLNDLVADLCLKNIGNRPSSLGDYTNIRATVGSLDFVEGLKPDSRQPVDLHSSTSIAAAAASGLSNASLNAGNSTCTLQPTHVPAPTQNSSFSFKHFLSSSTAMTVPSTTVTSLDPVGGSSAASAALTLEAAQIGGGSANSTSAQSSAPSLQTSTGARPKIPQSASGSYPSISSLMGVIGFSSDNSYQCAATKMKRSPRFSSFDSQASLAEYAGVASGESGLTAGSGKTTSGFRLCPDALGGESSDFFASGNGNNIMNIDCSGDIDRRYVPRSFSNYDMPMPMPCPTSSPRRRLGVLSTKENRPNRLALNTSATASSSASKLKLDLPIDASSGSGCDGHGVGAVSAHRAAPSNANEFPAAAAAAALPDFVQDHWLDSWYAHDMHLNSRSNSPSSDFVENLPGAAAIAVGGGIAAGCGARISGGGGGAGGGAAAATCGGPPVGGGSLVSGIAGEDGVFGHEAGAGAAKMLPDFLSDGPIIHSSQRLADVAAGLPSNTMGSPEDPELSTQLSRMRLENERLERELNETRVALSEQTGRANELERQLQERQRNEAAINRSMSQNITLVEESFDKNKRRTAAAQNHVTKLKQQVTQLTAEAETLRRENEVLREEGAVGGCSTASCDRPYATAKVAATVSYGSGGGVRDNLGRPSRPQKIARDLLMAASNAESNLRQLLTGVDNLRQMAADIQNPDLRRDYDVSPDLFSDFIDDCDDYEEYPGGPAL